MTRLETIEKSVEALTDEELTAFASWFDELRWQRWDRQIEADASSGKLDRLKAAALADIEAGKIRQL
jgi:ABC-type phosphate transport system auxiliary subunit